MLQNAGNMDRTKYLGGSDVAAILGISPWRTPLEVYLDKVQPRIKPIDPTKQKVFTRGQRMEPYVIDLLAEETGFEIVSRGNRYIHRDYGFIAAEIDFEYFDPGTGQVENGEIKTVSPFKAKEWGEVQTDAIPVHYTAQAMHGMMVTGKKVCTFGVLIGGDDFRIYRVERDEETIVAILQREVEFWDRVSQLNPPPATAVSDIMMMFEKDAGTRIEADGKVIGLYNELREMKGKYKELEGEIAVTEERIKLYMQDHAILTLDQKEIASWKSQSSMRFNQEAFSASHPKLFNKFKQASISRVFRLK